MIVPATKLRDYDALGQTAPVAAAFVDTDGETLVPTSRATPLPVSSANPANEYETVAASATDQALGATGATGDYLSHLIIVPATAAAGAVSIKDGSGSAISIFAGGGTTALPTLAPFTVFLGMKSTSGAWKVTTGANVSAIGVGDFT
jgi:hypothetical protein